MNPPRRIALSLSGGGYRAAGFHLGALSLLHRVGLLRNVAALSTVSGGTLIGARYARALLRGESFEAFFADFSRYLLRNNAVQRAIAQLGAGGARTVITSAANVYADEALLGDTRLGALFDADTHVDEWCFNATEFDAGIAFRFQSSRHPEARIGNGRYAIPRDAAAQIRLADIAAASSCFPGAFEPIVFPREFPSVPREGLADVALMDGGIYDNQGIDALLLADKRAPEERRFDLFIVSDSHRLRSGFLQLSETPPRGAKLRHLFHAGEALIAASGLGAALLAANTAWFWRDHSPTDAALRIAIVVLLAALTGTTVAAWQRLQHEVRAAIPEMSDDLWRMFGELRWSEAVSFVNLRVRSLLAMSADVFMKRIRALSYERLFHEKGPARTLNNLIYDLETAATRDRWPDLIPTAAQLAVAREASEVKTALWFDRGRADLDALIACGQNTLCLNLLQHVRQHGGEPAFVEQLETLWRTLRDDPRALL